MRAFRPFATAALSLAFTAVTAAYALPFQVQETTTTTSATSSSQTPSGTTRHRHVKKTTITPDGTTMSTSHTETDKSGATIDPATGEPAVTDQHSAQHTESVTAPDGSTASKTETHDSTTTTTPPRQ